MPRVRQEGVDRPERDGLRLLVEAGVARRRKVGLAQRGVRQPSEGVGAVLERRGGVATADERGDRRRRARLALERQSAEEAVEAAAGGGAHAERDEEAGERGDKVLGAGARAARRRVDLGREERERAVPAEEEEGGEVEEAPREPVARERLARQLPAAQVAAGARATDLERRRVHDDHCDDEEEEDAEDRGAWDERLALVAEVGCGRRARRAQKGGDAAEGIKPEEAVPERARARVVGHGVGVAPNCAGIARRTER